MSGRLVLGLNARLSRDAVDIDGTAIEIVNGNGVNGFASRLGVRLKTKGFQIKRLANAGFQARGGLLISAARTAGEVTDVVIEARREEAEAAAALAAPMEDDFVGGDEFDTLVETPESRD
mgnify:CR=1 FL=1